MSSLPLFVRKAPLLFYAFAIITLFWRIYNELATNGFTRLSEGADPFENVVRSIALYWGVAEALYMFGTGVMIHVLIAIYDKIGGSGE